MAYELRTLPPPIRGLNKKTEEILLDLYSPDLLNMIVAPTRLYKRLGYIPIGSNLPLDDGTGMEVIQFTDGVGNVHLLACTTTSIYLYDSDSDRWNSLNPSTLVENCEDDWVVDGTTVANSASAVTTPTPKVGSKCVDIEIDADVSDGDKLAYENITPVDLSSNAQLSFWIQSNIALAIDDIEIVLATDANGAKTNDFVEFTNDVAMLADTWYELTIAGDFSALTDVESVAIYVNHDDNLDGNVSDVHIYLDQIIAQTVFTGGSTDRWSHAILNDNTEGWQSNTAIVLSNNIDKPHVWDGDLANVFVELINDISDFSSVKELNQHFNHLGFYNVTDTTKRVRNFLWADIGDVDDFTTGTSGEKVLTQSLGEIKRVKQLRKSMIVYSDLSITEQYYVGGIQLFKHDTNVVETGLFAAKALWDLALFHYMIGTDQKFYAYAGGAALIPIAPLIEEDFFERLRVSEKENIVFGYDHGRHKLYNFFPDRFMDFNDTYGQSYYALNDKDIPQTWEFGRFSHTVRDFSIFQNQVNYRCNGAFFAGVACDEGSFKSRLRCDLAYAQDDFPTSVFISADGFIFKLDQTSGKDFETDIPCRMSTGDYTYERGNEDYDMRMTEFSFNSTAEDSVSLIDSTVNVYHSDDHGETWTEFVKSPVTLNGSGWTNHHLEFDVKKPSIRFKFEQESDGDFQLRSMTLKLQKETRRV